MIRLDMNMLFEQACYALKMCINNHIINYNCLCADEKLFFLGIYIKIRLVFFVTARYSIQILLHISFNNISKPYCTIYVM